MTALSYRTVDIDGYEIFYREAGDPARPALLLPSFPSPDGTALDSWYLQRPEVDEIQLPEMEEQRSTPYDRLPLTGSPANRLKHQ